MENIRFIIDDDSNWVHGHVKGNNKLHRFSAKVFEEPSGMGINNGCVSKLSISDVCHYDRGWDEEPKEENQEVYDVVYNAMENLYK